MGILGFFLMASGAVAGYLFRDIIQAHAKRCKHRLRMISPVESTTLRHHRQKQSLTKVLLLSVAVVSLVQLVTGATLALTVPTSGWGALLGIFGGGICGFFEANLTNVLNFRIYPEQGLE